MRSHVLVSGACPGLVDGLDGRLDGPVGRRRGWLVVLLALAGLATACSAGARASDRRFGPPEGAHTQAVLVGELCERGEPCTCRDLGAPGTGGVSGPDERVQSAKDSEDGDAQGAVAPDSGDGGDGGASGDAGAPSARRVELRLRSSHELWLRVGEWTFLKDRERAESCYYIDLPRASGGASIPVELRASHPDGVSAGLVVSELGVAARTWYQTLSWSCGAPGACSFEELEAQKAEASRAAAEHKLFDPCGSLQVSGLSWDSRVAPDHEYPGDLTLRFALKVTARVPDKPAGDPSCGN